MVFCVYSLLLGLILVSHEVSRAMDCLQFKCGVSGKVFTRWRFDRVALQSWREVPYLVTLQDESDKVFCLGVLIKVDRVLTVASCTFKENFVRRTVALIKIRSGNLKLDEGETRKAVSIIVHPQCEKETTNLLRKNCDFAVIVAQSPFSGSFSRTAPFFSMNPENIMSAIENTENCRVYSECPCVAYGYGRYNVWQEKKEDGKWKWTPELHEEDIFPSMKMHPVQLFSKHACNTWNKKCCRRSLHEQWFTDHLYGQNTIRCAVRGIEYNQCMGETGGPVVCSGRVVGLVKGYKYCADNEQSGRFGEIIYVGMEHGIKFVKEHYEMNTDAFPSGPDTSMFNNISLKMGNANGQDNAKLAEYDDYYSNFSFRGPTFKILPFLSLILLTIKLV